MEANIKTKSEYSQLSIQKRLLSILIVVAFIFCAIFIRLFILQVNNTENYQIKAIEQWVRTLPLKANRGKLLDTNGNVLAKSQTSYDVYVRAKEIDEPVVVANFLSNILELNFENVYKKTCNKFISESLVKLNIDTEKAKKIVNRNLKGVYLSQNISRTYPYGKLSSQVLGYLTADSIGQSGVEKYYNTILSGTDGKYLTQSDVRGITLDNSLNYYIDPIDGLNVNLSIDINIQNILESVMEKVNSDHAPKSVSALVLDPKTSQILGMAMSPSFDLNNIPRDDIQTLLQLTKNTTVTDVYEPGSTFKILTLAAALSENLTNINERFYCSGFRIIDGEKIKCWKTTGHGSQTLVECVQNSCNCCFMDLALRLGKDKLYDYLQKFGIGKLTGVDILGESSGILIEKSQVKPVDLARISFGQSVAVSQLQLINAFCSAINGGTLNKPSLLKNYSNENDIIYKNSNIIINKTIDHETSQKINYLLEMSLSKTGEMTFIDGYKVAGKTGTAQKYGADGKISKGKYVSSFFGYLLDDSYTPSYALLLCVDESSSGAYYGSVVAKPYAKEIFEKIIKYKNIAKQSDVETPEIEVPNFLNMSLSEALAILDKMNLSYETAGEGSKVVSQFPLAGTKIKASTTLLINT